MSGILIKWGNLKTVNTHPREHHMKMKAEIRVILLHAKKCQRLPENHSELVMRHGGDSPSQTSGGTSLFLVSGIQPPEL